MSRRSSNPHETLKKANPTGQFPKPLTVRFPDGTPLRTADGKLRKEFITVPFLLFGAHPPCFRHTYYTCLWLCVYSNFVCTRVHPMMPRTYPHVTVTPRLGHNDTTDLPAQLTFNVTPPHLVHSSSRRELYQERVTPLLHFIACIVDYGNLQL